MWPKAFLIALAIVVSAVAPAVATNYIVGDAAGWELGVNYTNWAKGKNFYVGDSLTFIYSASYHNVAKVNGTDFVRCLASDPNNILDSGNDTIILKSPGKKWYLCSVEDHCPKGMKLSINVHSASEAPAPAPTPGSLTRLSFRTLLPLPLI